MPIAFRPTIQHRLTRATGQRWALMPHAYAFVDPLFSTGIAWSLRAVERLGLVFEEAASGARVPDSRSLARYETMLSAEADQIDLVVAGAYEAMTHFELFAAQAMLYFATVSFAEVSQRLAPTDAVAWNGFLGVGDPVLESVARESLDRLRTIGRTPWSLAARERAEFSAWMSRAIAPRNIAGLADPRRANLYPVDFDALVEGHSLLGMTRDEIVAGLPTLRGMSAADPPALAHGSGLAAAGPESPLYAPDEANQPR
jgi:FADH2 O2-dependent halogenase